MESLYVNIALTFMYATPIIVAAIGGLYSERSGVTNIGIEGLMTIGAFAGACICYYMGQNADPTTFMGYAIIPWLSVLAGALVGGVFSLIHAVASIKYKADQVISGTAINMLAIGLAIFLSQILFQQQRTPQFSQGFKVMNDSIFAKIPVIGGLIAKTYPPFIFALIIVALTAFIVKKTKFGLRLRACGEFPQAASSMGVNVYRTRYIGVFLSGIFAGAAGAIMTLTVDSQFSETVIHGFGFIAIATLIFGKWNAWGVLFAGLFFGLSNVIAISSGQIDMFKSIPKEIFYMLPYVATILALVITSGKAAGPKANGEIYDEGKR
ncbi:MAG: ABC transporter permease [Coprobacillus sp.]